MFQVFAIIVALIVVILSPLIAIWSVNTLFVADIQYNISTFFASLYILGVLTVRFK